MSDVEIWTDGKKDLIELFNQEADATEIFSLRHLKPKTFLKHKVDLKSPSKSLSPVFSYQDIYNKGYDFFIGNMSLSFKTSAINGVGTVAYCDYFGYAAIERMTIKVGDAEFVFDGEYFFNKIVTLPAHESILEDAGHNDDCRRAATSVDLYEEIKPSQSIKVLLPLPFGSNFPKNLLPIAVNDKIRVEFIMKHMTALINSNKSSNLKMEGFSDFNLSIELYTRKSGIRAAYEPRIDLPITITPSTRVSEKKDIIEIPNSRFFSISQKCPIGDKTFPALISNWKNESDVVDKFLEFLIDNLLYVTDKKDELLKEFPSTAKLVEVQNGEAVIRVNEEFSQKRIVTISIKDLPPNTSLLYHANLLTINKFSDDDWCDDFNISEKIISIVGYYDVTLKKIIPIKVKHILSSQHASIPLEVFETLGEDNRKLNSQSYVIRSFFASGANMFKSKPVSSLIIYNSKDNSKDNSKESPSDIIHNEIENDSLRKVYAYSPFEKVIEFSHQQNDSRFTFKNINSGNFIIEVYNKDFKITKSEVVKEFKPNKEFREPRHKEEGFESLYHNRSYKVTYYQSSQISQNVSSSGDKISTYLQSV